MYVWYWLNSFPSCSPTSYLWSLSSGFKVTLDPSGEHSTVRICCSSEMLVPMKKGDCAVWIIVTVAVVCAESSTRCHVHPLTCMLLLLYGCTLCRSSENSAWSEASTGWDCYCPQRAVNKVQQRQSHGKRLMMLQLRTFFRWSNMPAKSLHSRSTQCKQLLHTTVFALLYINFIVDVCRGPVKTRWGFLSQHQV